MSWLKSVTHMKIKCVDHQNIFTISIAIFILKGKTVSPDRHWLVLSFVEWENSEIQGVVWYLTTFKKGGGGKRQKQTIVGQLLLR